LSKAILAISLFILLLARGEEQACGQEVAALRPDRSLFPALLAGPRDPSTSFNLLFVSRNPSAHGRGVEAEVSLGATLPTILLGEKDGGHPVVVGIEAAVFARFGLQVLERELIASDWIFAIPVVWHRDGGWFRFRYYHTSSHMGDEYARRFEDPGINLARDAAEILYFHALNSGTGVYGGARYAYNVHPNESKRWALRAGGQLEAPKEDVNLRPFIAADLEWDQDAGRSPRLEVNAGMGLRKVGILRSLRLSLTFLTGPSPLGQFNGRTTTQAGLTILKTL
jgi:hypothetical protein